MARSTFSPLPVADTSVNEISGRPVVLKLPTSLRPGQFGTPWLGLTIPFASVGSQAAWRQPSALMSELKS
jgi:hypothetical protein